MNPVVAVDQANMIADHDVAISRRRRFKASIEVAGHGANGPPHIGREDEPISNFGLPIVMPVATFAIAKSAAVMLIILARNLAIVIVETVVVVTISIVIAAVVIALISAIVLIMMIAIVMILCVSQGYAQKQAE